MRFNFLFLTKKIYIKQSKPIVGSVVIYTSHMCMCITLIYKHALKHYNNTSWL